MVNQRSIMWFRQDLRLADNPALTAACLAGEVLPIYILDDINADEYAMGGASRWWLFHALKDLNESLQGKLSLFIGEPLTIIEQLIDQYNIEAIFWNRCYEPWRIKRDGVIKKKLKHRQIQVQSFNGSLLWEPWEIAKKDGCAYRVFTPYYQRGCLSAPQPREIIDSPPSIDSLDCDYAVSLEELNLLPKIRWYQTMQQYWQISEQAAHDKLEQFIACGLDDYQQGRNFPAQANVSQLSPYLHFGQLSPNQVWYAVRQTNFSDDVKTFCSELGWREFAYYLLYHFPQLPYKNWNNKFDGFSWSNDEELLLAWQQGKTGIPIVDAGMRELWQTGYMHNRVRMIVASFLVKNCLVDWRLGERWFWDCLVDADLASNSASWQWVAGCGADAAPYFRIFNPVTQGQKFDSEGKYTKKYVPELKAMPSKYLYNPWEAPAAVLKQAGIELGNNYPHPIVDLKASRQLALDAYQRLTQI